MNTGPQTTETHDDAEPFQRLVHRFAPGSTLLRVWPLIGGVSANVTALEIARSDGQRQRVIARRHGAVDLRQNPRIAADEFRLLQRLRAAGIPCPTPYYLDESGEIFPTPVIVVEYIDGAPEFAPADLPSALRQLASLLAAIHAVDYAQHDLSFLPSQTDRYTEKLRNRPAMLDDSLDEGRIRDALEAVWPMPQHNHSVLLHGDFWPGNTLWRDGELLAIIDWEDAAIGDPLADLGNSRLEILWAYGVEAMETFTRFYLALNPIDVTNLPYWDLCAALKPASKLADWAGDAATEARMRSGHRTFVTQAFDQLVRRGAR